MRPTKDLMALAAIYSPPRPAPGGTPWAWWGEGRDSPDRHPYGRPLPRWERQQAAAALAREAEIAARAEAHPARRFTRAVNAALRAADEAGLAPAYDWPGDPAGQFALLRRLGMPAHHAAHYVAWAPLANSVLAGIYCPRDVARALRGKVAALLREARAEGARGTDPWTGVFDVTLAQRKMAARAAWDAALRGVRAVAAAGKSLAAAAAPADAGLRAVAPYFGEPGFPSSEREALATLAEAWRERAHRRARMQAELRAHGVESEDEL